MKQFRLPDPGEGLVEAEIVSWRVGVGDTVKVNDIVVEVETSKSLVELPIPYAGTVTALLAEEGQMVDVGTPIITVDDGTGPVTEPAGSPQEDLVPELPPAEDEVVAEGTIGGSAPGGRVAVLVGYGPRTTDAKRRPRKGHAEEPGTHGAAALTSSFSTAQPVSRQSDVRTPMPPNEAQPVGGPLPGPGSQPAEPVIAGGPVLAKPPVRKLAKDLGVDLAGVAGSGAGGVITRQDVEAAAAPPAAAQSTRAAGKADVRIPIKGVRKMTAEAMVSSAFTAPHVTEWLTLDVSATMELVDRLRTRREFADVRVSPLVIIAKAACLALQRHPELNSSWDAAAGEIVIKGQVNLGIAAATPRGLLVPNIKDAGSLSLLELAAAIGDLVGTAKEGRTQPAETSQGSFTITNVGVFGVDAGTPILNPGEAGILCVGAIARRPWVVGSGAQERIEPRWVTTLALSFDHRLVDGEHGSKFLAEVGTVLSDPALALLY
ncbi:dihydrolipoamide acetyltransferase family protein [Microlunatus panaciterrae]|uniref:Dihydrolipoamide acetyltransferase component of pyruvate dehydrogenase complex n=1 Tax=Microlunatus panaciterrae TaxID=400768 RepID=A0ABS2RI92_9ACTN|nr:dihydrolipoamide acetyltransferase family protein [Microlunatus panaciterrae]MBM7798718.1 pyruvate dehydrogenase E2 component (dihydrolipoamide acetyltransferase) [Microlunatus panaciterrae]